MLKTLENIIATPTIAIPQYDSKGKLTGHILVPAEDAKKATFEGQLDAHQYPFKPVKKLA